MRRRRRMRMAGAASLAAAMLLVAGCAGQTAGLEPLPPLSAEELAALDLPPKDRASWLMPLDEYAFPSAVPMQDYAENLLVSECLQESGFRWPIAPIPLEDADYVTESTTPLMVRRFDVDLGREWGYHDPDDVTRAPRIRDMLDMNAVAESQPGFSPVFTACLEQVREVQPRTAIGSMNRVWSGAGQAYDTAENDETVRSAADAWQRCLANAGYDGAPENPIEMPTEDMRERAGLPPLPNMPDVPQPPLTTAERKLATADAECRESSGWAEARYDAEWAGQAAFIAANKKQLEEDRDAWSSHRLELLEVIATHAPLHPAPDAG